MGRPKEDRRHLLVNVVLSILLYVAPVLVECLEYSKQSVKALLKILRRTVLRKMCGYNSVSYDVVNVIAAMQSIDLLAVERKE